MDLERAFRRREQLHERLARIERIGHPGLLPAASGHRTCPTHGDYAAAAQRCPVCEGSSTGNTWSGWQHNPDHDVGVDPLTLEPLDWFERHDPPRTTSRRTPTR